MTFQAVDYAKKVFFECYKSIENFQAVDVCLCEQYRGCQSIENFQKNKRRYCYVCQFQDRFNLILLNQVKFDLKKIMCFYNEILITSVEMKKLTSFNNGEYFLERYIFYVFDNEKINLEEMINFLLHL